jgi:malonyl-CoA/methylmalonyl-CoA synthetase
MGAADSPIPLELTRRLDAGSIDTCVALIANAATGFVTVPLDPKLGPRELGHIVADSRPVVTLAANPDSVKDMLAEVPDLSVVKTE